jgi:Icc protein
VNAGVVDAIGTLGADQLQWLADDLSGRSSSTPVFVFAHLPLWALYPEWGWTTTDSEQALSHLKRFGSVTVLNGRAFRWADESSGGPIIAGVLGITEVEFRRGNHALAITDESVAGTPDEKNGA